MAKKKSNLTQVESIRHRDKRNLPTYSCRANRILPNHI